MLAKPLFLTFFGSKKRLLALSLCALSVSGVSCQGTGLTNTGPSSSLLQPGIPYMGATRSGSGGHLRVAALVAPELVPALCAPQEVRPASSNAEIDREYRGYLEKALALRQQQLDLTRRYQPDTSRELSDQRKDQPNLPFSSAPTAAPSAEPTYAPTSMPFAEPSSAPTSAPSAQPYAPAATATSAPSAQPYAPAATATPAPYAATTPLPAATSDISIIEKSTMNGKVYDQNQQTVDGAIVKARSLNPSVPYEGSTITAGGTYAFNNLPSGVQIEIVVEAPSIGTLKQIAVLKSNKQGDPNANRFDFGTAPSPSPLPTATPMPTATPTPEQTATPTPLPTPTPTPLPEPSQLRDFFYFSYDDSASTAAVELVKEKLNRGQMPHASLARPWEFLNRIHFPYENQEETGLFKVSMGMDRIEDSENPFLDNYDLGVHVTAPALCRQARPPMVLTLVIDVSGSMNEIEMGSYDEIRNRLNKLELARKGLYRLKQELVPGDVVNLVTFSDTAATKAENLQMPEANATLSTQIEGLRPAGGTNLNAGLQEGYRIARKYYQPDKTNRVLLLTDAYANQGEVDPLIISRQTQINDKAGIYFSGLGFGAGFNEAFLNQLTEVGKGSYYAIVNEEDATRAFGERFLALTHAAARNLRFKLDYPAWLKHGESAAEEISLVAEGVQPTHFSFNTSQFFLERFRANKNPNKASDTLRLEISYTLPSTGEKRTEVYEKPLSELLGKEQASIQNARLITALTGLIQGNLSPERVRKEIRDLKN
ncbi:MAG: VWA domain-containing protein [Candidatus Sericytochromatia bacterium]|nr:VWA domain-containing protein [Candidatus Sericytochromatia bacterium]